MKRHMELILELLKFAEMQENGSALPPEMSSFTCRQIHYHVQLCGEAKYMHVRKVSQAGESFTRYCMDSLTWSGHEALEKLRGAIC